MVVIQIRRNCKIEGAKNAVLPILAATLLAEEGVTTLKMYQFYLMYLQ